jgi:hypothetical protein
MAPNQATSPPGRYPSSVRTAIPPECKTPAKVHICTPDNSGITSYVAHTERSRVTLLIQVKSPPPRRQPDAPGRDTPAGAPAPGRARRVPADRERPPPTRSRKSVTDWAMQQTSDGSGHIPNRGPQDRPCVRTQPSVGCASRMPTRPRASQVQRQAASAATGVSRYRAATPMRHHEDR